MKNNPDIIWLDVAESSNDEARKTIDSLDNLSVIAVRCQTKGRGQRTNIWETAPGKNLTFTIILKNLAILPSEQIAISQITALSVVDYLAMHGITAKIKLPNDIYVGGKKICGILIENSICSNKIVWSIVGVGININQTTFPSSLPNPTSILLEKSNPELDLTQQLAKFHEIYSAYYTKYLSSRNESALTEVDYLFKSKLLSL
jgi:BirA family biotin operon repressor/biotin-[acetyl-CoA-carboxylase] ligase